MKALVALLCIVCTSLAQNWAEKELSTCYSPGLDSIMNGGSKSTGEKVPAIFLTEAAQKSGAVCLDGSPGVYYWQAGTGSGADKWYIHHMGGGWCASTRDCYSRSKTNLGTSTLWPNSVDITEFGGYFSNDQKTNPMLYNWNKVFMAYCDGGSFAGLSNHTVSYEGHVLHYRGFAILNAVIEDLLANKGLAKSTDVVISGCSAGGLATYLHVDHWASFLPHAKVVGLPDSGFFMDYQGPPHYHSDMIWVFENMNATVGVNQRCIAANPSNEWKCYFAQYTAPHIRTPVFPLQSKYDAWQLPNILGNTKNDTLVDWFGSYLTTQVKQQLLTNSVNGIWLDACFHHCGEWASFHIDGDTEATAFEKWYHGKGRIWTQNNAYPCESCCK